MTWLKILVAAIVVGGIFGYLTSGNKEGAKKGAASFGIGCGIFYYKSSLHLQEYIYCLLLEAGYLGKWLPEGRLLQNSPNLYFKNKASKKTG